MGTVSGNHFGGTIAYLGSLDFPERNAAANLAIATSATIAISGYRVVICGRQGPESCTADPVLPRGVYLRLRPTHKGWMDRVNPVHTLSFYLACLRSEKDLVMVIAYNMPALVLTGVLAWARRRHLPVIAHCTEWYARVPWRSGFLHAAARNVDTALRMRLLHRLVDALLVSSHYLREFYGSKKTLVYPTLSSNLASGETGPRSAIPRLIYAGQPFAAKSRNIRARQMKDRLDLILELLRDAYEGGARFQFDVYGLTREAYIAAVPKGVRVLDKLADSVVFHGKVKSEFAAAAIRDADYSILIRDRNRVTLAGFPTKFSESVLQGTPVLANAVGEIERYLRGGVNGFVLSRTSADVHVLSDALALGPEDRAAFKELCAKNSRNLSAEAWVQTLGNFIGSVCSRNSTAGDHC